MAVLFLHSTANAKKEKSIKRIKDRRKKCQKDERIEHHDEIGEYKSVRDEKQWLLRFFSTAHPRPTWFGLGQAITTHKKYHNFELFLMFLKIISGRLDEITQCSSILVDMQSTVLDNR